jgi:hypothetical protein
MIEVAVPVSAGSRDGGTSRSIGTTSRQLGHARHAEGGSTDDATA